MTVTEQLSALDSILAHGDLHCLFQPILSLSERRLVGYEALTRGPSNSPLHSPLALFAVARQCGRLSELELLCRQRAFSRFRYIQGTRLKNGELTYLDHPSLGILIKVVPVGARPAAPNPMEMEEQQAPADAPPVEGGFDAAPPAQ